MQFSMVSWALFACLAPLAPESRTQRPHRTGNRLSLFLEVVATVEDQIFFSSKLALCPPKPKLLLMARVTRLSRALCGT